MSQDLHNNMKVSGYLEKKGKIKLKSWKKYWFVLEGRLLLYYRSKEEYESISPCKGSINLGPPCNIIPTIGMSCTFQIETRAQTINLRAADRSEQEKWLQAILPIVKHSCINQDKLIHFRYSNDDLMQNKHQESSVNKSFSCNKNLADRMISIGAHSYGGSVGTITKMAESFKKPNLPQSRSLVKLLQNKSDLDVSFTCGDEKHTKSPKIRKSNSYIVENDQYISRNFRNSGTEYDVTIRDSRNNVENIYERISGSSSEDRKSVTVVNDTYEFAENVATLMTNNEYAVPYKKTDHNKNSLLVENDTYTPFSNNEVNPYAVTIQDVEYASVDNIYENPDDLKVSSQIPSVPPPRTKKTDKKEHEQEKGGEPKSKSSIGQSIRKHANRMSKIWKKKNKKESVDSLSSSKEETNETVLLEELQKILDNKKQEIQKKIQEINLQEKENTAIVSEKTEEKKEEFNPEENNTQSDLEKPNLPPHQHLQCPSPIYDVPQNNCPIISLFLPKKKSKQNCIINKNDKIKTIDEILEDLDNEKHKQLKPSVKELIEVFDEKNKDEVVLRKKPVFKPANDRVENIRHSDELTMLLEELKKVTNAPILTPGITNSLNISNKTNTDWQKIMPQGHRRNSEPDYDIPRSHKPFHLQKQTSQIEQNLNNIEQANNNKEQANTKEFSTVQQNFKKSDWNQPFPKIQYIVNVAEEIQKNDEIIYAKPRSLFIKLEHDDIKNKVAMAIVSNASESLDIFPDSLEQESSTPF